MKLSLRQVVWYLIALALIAAGVMVYWYSTSPTPINRSLLTKSAILPDTKIQGVTLLRYNASGHLAHTVSAQSAEQYDKQSLMLFQQPKMASTADNGSQWLAGSDKGRLFEQNTLELINNVQVNLISQRAKQHNLVLTTENLFVHLNEQKAYSNTRSELRGSFDTILADRFEADLNSETIHFYNHVQGQHLTRPIP